MLLGTLGARFVGNLLSQKGMLRAGYGKGMVRAVMEIKWIFNSVSSFHKPWNTKILWK